MTDEWESRAGDYLKSLEHILELIEIRAIEYEHKILLLAEAGKEYNVEKNIANVLRTLLNEAKYV